METITMWAEMSDKATNARRNAAPDTHVQNAILDIDAAKIRKDAEDAIRNDAKLREQKVYLYYDPRLGISPVRGGWTKAKILKRLKDIVGAKTGYSFAARRIAEFDSPEELAEHMFYHGTQYGGGRLKPSILMSDRELERLGGGGYGEKYWGVSVSKSKRVASNFSSGRTVSVYPVILVKNAKIKEMPELRDAADLEDCIESLWKEGIDAVWIGDKDKGEQELCVLNPAAMVNIDTPDIYRSYKLGTSENPLNTIDSDGINKLYEDAKRYVHALENKPQKPEKPSRFLPSEDGGVIGELKDEEVYQQELSEYETKLEEYNNSEAARRFRDEDEYARRNIRFFRTADGHAYGFTVGGRVYIDPRIATAETPIHEYSHLWATAFRRVNPKEWKHIVELMKGTSVWNEVKTMYPELKSDDEIADEVLAQFSGRRGAERLRRAQEEALASDMGVFGKAAAVNGIARVKEALKRFWRGVADWLGIRFKSAEEVADKVLADLLNGVNPAKVAKDGSMRYQFVGEKGAEGAFEGKEGVSRYLSSFASRHGLSGTAMTQEIGSREELEALRERLEDRAFRAVQEEWEKKGVFGCYLPRLGLSVVFTEKFGHDAETAESVWWHEQTHHFTNGLSKADLDRFGGACLDFLKIRREDLYNNIVGHYPQTEWADEACACLIQSIVEAHGTEKLLKSSFAGNEAVATFVTKLTNNFKNGKEGTISNRLQRYEGIGAEEEISSVHGLGVQGGRNGELEERAGVSGQVGQGTRGSETAAGGEGLTDPAVYRLRTDAPPRKTGVGYKVFVLKDGKLYPPMVANPGGEATPVGVWLDADAAPVAGVTKTGRQQVKAGGKGTQGGSGKLAYRPGWHLGEIPYALQFNRVNPETGEKELFPANFVWAEVEYADDVDYQEEAMSYGMNASGKFQHSLAGLPRLPKDGSYKYRTNPNPETDPWIITGAMKVNRILKPSEVDAMVEAAGREPQPRQAGAVTDAQVEALNANMRRSMQEDRDLMRRTAERLAERLNTPVRIIEDVNDITHPNAALQERRRRAKGWFDTVTGEVTIVVPNHSDVADIGNTLVHELVGHGGLRVLFPTREKLNNALDELYRVSTGEIREAIDRMAQKMYEREVERLRGQKRLAHEAKGEDANAAYYADMAEAHAEAAKKREQFRRDATEEYGADLAGRIGESGFEKMSADELTSWGKLKGVLQKALDSLLRGLGISGKRKWGDKEWAFVLHEAYKRKVNGGRPSVFDVADTEVMRRKTGFGEATDREAEGRMSDNERFNSELTRYQNGEMDKNEMLHLGKPQGVMRLFLPDIPIVMRQRILKKGSVKKHNVDVEALANMPQHLSSPIFVFQRSDNALGVLTEMQDRDGKNVCVAIELNRKIQDGGEILEVNDIRSVHGRNVADIVFPIVQNGTLKWVDKEKGLAYLSSASQYVQQEIDKQDLDSATKVVENFENPKVSDEKVSDDEELLFRDGDGVEYEKAQARGLYEGRVGRGLYQMQEALQDSMLGLKEAMSAVLRAEGKDMAIEEVDGFENAYLGENRLSSVNKAECDEFARRLFRPMLEVVSGLARTADERAELTDYMMAKHGLERNVVMARPLSRMRHINQQSFQALTKLIREA
ncbi:MAG: hypothetical protein SPK03_02560 [Alloprevotella sp.]|nr:hypothetical protein [Alloprevotella sp.]